jgi:16S rRNA (adenine1518-N6/adenine1519-N6)-dimethyltransferase
VTRVRKRFGQHFLEDVWVQKVIAAVAPEPNQYFIEVGPGHGALTRPLALGAAHVLAFEIDRDLVAGLQTAGPVNLAVVAGDFLSVTAPQLRALLPDGLVGPLRMAGNLPYNVASPILFKLVELYAAGIPLLDATVMLQREVVDRLVAGPGSREYGVLSVLIQHMADVERLVNLPPGAFRPPPPVQSALVRLRFHPPEPAASNPAGFASLVQAVFTRRRKTLANALLAYRPVESIGSHVPPPQFPAPAETLARAGLNGTRRPETLSVAEFVGLSDCYPGGV